MPGWPGTGTTRDGADCRGVGRQPGRGIASAAFIAYLSSLTNVSYSATQYALFSSMMLLLPKFVAGFSGDYVNAFGYAQFFTSTALLGLPVLLLVWLASKGSKQPLTLDAKAQAAIFLYSNCNQQQSPAFTAALHKRQAHCTPPGTIRPNWHPTALLDTTP